jgi:hypothetical protein
MCQTRPADMDRTGKPAGPPGAGWRPRALVIAVVILLLIILIAAVLGALAMRRYETYLSGLWVGDPGFLARARLRDLQLFLAPREGGRRQGYLIMTDLDGAFLSNQAIEVRERAAAQRWWTALRSVFRTSGDAYASNCVEIEYDDCGERAGEGGGADPPMPERMKMALSMLDGTLTLYDQDKVYAFLEKDLTASAAAVAAYGAPDA